MTQKTICDRCGADQNVGRFTIDFARSDPHTSDSLPVNRDSDLCVPCLKEVKTALQGILDLAKMRTRP